MTKISNALSQAEMKKLLHYAENRESTNHGPLVKWPKPSELKLIAKAYKKGERSVVLEAGEFKISYDEEHKQVHLAPVEGMLPRGWFDYGKLNGALTDAA